jgi:hypothetical protein
MTTPFDTVVVKPLLGTLFNLGVLVTLFIARPFSKKLLRLG